MTNAHSLVYLAGFLLLTDAFGLLVFLGTLRQVGVVGQSVEQRRHLRPSVHLLLWDDKKGEKRVSGGDKSSRKRGVEGN